MVATMLWIDWTSREQPEDRAKFLMQISAASIGPRKCDTMEMADWANWFNVWYGEF